MLFYPILVHFEMETKGLLNQYLLKNYTAPDSDLLKR